MHWALVMLRPVLLPHSACEEADRPVPVHDEEVEEPL